jgi:hypothetical protein
MIVLLQTYLLSTKPVSDGHPNNEPLNKPATLKPFNDLAAINPNTRKTLETSIEGIRREGIDVTRSGIASLTGDDKTKVDGGLESNIPIITHAIGMVILDKYFPNSAVDLRTLNGADAPDKLATPLPSIVCLIPSS